MPRAIRSKKQVFPASDHEPLLWKEEADGRRTSRHRRTSPHAKHQYATVRNGQLMEPQRAYRNALPRRGVFLKYHGTEMPR